MVISKDIPSADYRRAVEFHGHECPGLAIGYRAARWAMELLGVKGRDEEEVVAIVENDSCAVDAIQVLTGCTLGKGNLFLKDYGKMALTLGDRRTRKAWRVVLRPHALALDPLHLTLAAKIREGTAVPEEKEQFEELHRGKNLKILEMKREDLFRNSPQELDFPEKARIMAAKECALCGEPTMESRLEQTASGLVCRACRKPS